MENKTEMLKSVLSDEAFVTACIEAENEEAVQKLFADKGIEMSLTEIELMKEMVCAVAEGDITTEQLEKLSNGGELSEEELEEAAGGDWLAGYNRLKDFFGKETGQCSIATDGYYLRASASKIGSTVIGGVILAGAAAYGICKACGVDVEGGIKSAYNWVADKVTSRW